MSDLIKTLQKIFSAERLKTRLIDLVAYANDAGFYHLTPKAVVQPINETEVQQLFQVCVQLNVPLTFRAGGSSLSGQSITDGVLVDLGQHWRNVTPSADGKLVRVQPGVTGSMVNKFLQPYHVKIGPDPSSINSAMMSGIISNNASGMCCGVALNSYHTMKYIRFMLPNGKVYDTEQQKDYKKFETESNIIFNGLQQLRQQVLSNDALLQRIRKKYLTKNTVGYSLNAFVDFEHPLDMLAHLLVGGEGTLAFIAEAVMQTVPDYAYKLTDILFFETMAEACNAIIPIKNAGAEMIEVMDRASLRSIEHINGIPSIIPNLPLTAAALLVEFQDDALHKVEEKLNAFEKIADIKLLQTAVFTGDTVTRDLYWKVRKGMFPSVGSVRAKGTTVLLEDIAFPVAQLANALADLQLLFEKYGYSNAIIFGHAKDGNIHFVVTQSFNGDEEVKRYENFMDEVVQLVVKKYDGALKAEHGTGRNMAPFVETEWGCDAYEIMKTLKALIDPHNILNPGVIINDDAKAHIKNLKQMPEVEEEVDKCIECGNCEPICPSRDITLTPRRRIVVRRALQILKIDGNEKDYQTLLKQYQYDGLDTCAVDGLCASDCPVDINTGDLVKRLRKENHSSFENRLALMVAKNFSITETSVKLLLKSGVLVNSVFGKQAMTSITSSIKKIAPAFPKWMPTQTGPVHLPANINGKPQFVYFATCITRCMGKDAAGKLSVVELLMQLSAKAGFVLQIPENIHGSCCGQPFSSKGFNGAATFTKNKTVEWLWQQSQQGLLPIVLDMSSCTHTLLDARPFLSEENKKCFDKLLILDSVDYLHDYVLPKLNIQHKKQVVALHPVCSLIKMKNSHKLLRIAKQCAVEVHVPLYAGCCGMAGDRGMLHPELTKAATLMEAKELSKKNVDGYFSSSKTCEMALAEATQNNYQSIAQLVWEVVG